MEGEAQTLPYRVPGGFFCVGLVQKEMLSFLVNAEYLLSTEDVISN